MTKFVVKKGYFGRYYVAQALPSGKTFGRFTFFDTLKDAEEYAAKKNEESEKDEIIA